MNAQYIFIASAIIGWIGVIGLSYENLSGRMNRYTRWKDMTNRQWAFCYAMVQFPAVIVVTVLYLAVKELV